MASSSATSKEMPLGLEILQSEHSSIRAVLDAFEQALKNSKSLDYGFLRTILLYLEVFPRQLHHPKEEQYLFPRVVRHLPSTQETIALLWKEHAANAAAALKLEQSLAKAERSGEISADFEREALAFVQAYRAHLEREEHELFPLVLQALSTEDWEEIGEAFAVNIDPLMGIDKQYSLTTLVRRLRAALQTLAHLQIK